MSSLEIERLESLLRSTSAASNPEIRTAIERIDAELLDRLSQSSPESIDLFSKTMRALGKVRGTGNTAPRLRCLERCWTFFIHHGNFTAALDAANHHYLLATKAAAHASTKLSLNVMGVVCAELGNISQALVHYSRALESARDIGDAEWQSVILNNLGTALNYAGLYGEAIPCFREVLVLKNASWKFPLEKRALTNLAQSYYYLGRLEEAFSAIQGAVRETSQPENAKERFDQAIREFTFVEIALEGERNQLAYDHALRCRNHALLANSAPARLIADIAAGRCEVRLGNVQAGLAKLSQVISRSQSIDSVQRDALIAAVKAYDEAGQPEAALSHIERLLQHVRERRMGCMHTLLSYPAYEWLDSSQLCHDADLMPLEHRHAHLQARVAERRSANSKREMLERLAMTADLKEDASGEHGYRVGKMAALLASRIGWTREAAHSLELAARLHDIGKICIPDRILGSSEMLRDAERKVMSLHTVIGAELLAQSDVPQLRLAEDIARFHHEWWNGAGYPTKRAGKLIPLHARIAALADVFDALTHGRPFAPAWDTNQALAEIRARRGAQFEPDLTDQFVSLIQGLVAEYGDLDAFLGKESFRSPFRAARQKIRAILEEELGRTPTRGTQCQCQQRDSQQLL